MMSHTKQTSNTQSNNFLFNAMKNQNFYGQFPNWANNDFNLLDFIGTDPDDNQEETKDNIEYGLSEEERNFQQKDKLYTTLQYNQNMFNDYQNGAGNHFGIENQFPDTMGFMNSGQGQMQMQDSRGILGASSGYNGSMIDSSMIPTTSKSVVSNQQMQIPIKSEPTYDAAEMNFNDSGAYSDVDSHYSHSIGSMDTGYNPKTKPRKYRVKPDEEKRNPVYRVKREKNNDAVRRSRDKAKRIQIEKDERLAFLEQEVRKENLRNKETMARLSAENAKLKSALAEGARRCKCGALRPH